MNREESIRFATKFLEDMISFFGVNVAVRSTYEEDVIHLAVPSTSLNAVLIGRNAETLRGLQNLVAAALAQKEAELTRVNIDIAGYKEQRATHIETRAKDWVERVRREGRIELDLNAADRRIVHKYIEDISDVDGHSEGVGRERKLILELKKA
jgi:spoIIIJ-associated protein